ncbi:hypothetical protein [Paenibacillus sp. UASWS1643]|uniref:hypothetical protein n=1 Tax=Paenibacillus sp. UASWS1643 TaxID=2580422 RepID=UPI00123B0877|nr:hypothetical protein [Paenibacillus sp. UASWS1643]KAA8746343.1 hypothetical protein FE296_31635 [Paenibacillus sp. UASWS1643]
MENKETFNLVTNQYERYRPLYPSEMFHDIFTYLNLNKEDSILEIGSGTAFHFIDPEVGYRRAWELLENTGGMDFSGRFMYRSMTS